MKHFWKNWTFRSVQELVMLSVFRFVEWFRKVVISTMIQIAYTLLRGSRWSPQTHLQKNSRKGFLFQQTSSSASFGNGCCAFSALIAIKSPKLLGPFIVHKGFVIITKFVWSILKWMQEMNIFVKIILFYLDLCRFVIRQILAVDNYFIQNQYQW